MLKMKRVVIAQHERGLYLEDRSIVRVLSPGVYWNLSTRVHIVVLDTRNVEVIHDAVSALVESNRELAEQYFQVLDLGEYEIGLLYQRNTLQRVLAPGERYVFWRENKDLRINIVDIKEDYRLAKDLAKVLVRRSVRNASEAVYPVEVASSHIGLLWVDGKLINSLKPGVYAYWRYNRNTKVEHVDLRLQAIDVSGQEILTKDKVSLRINLTAVYKVVDAVTARLAVNVYSDHVYLQLQHGLREAVATRTLDTLLADKESLNGELYQTVKANLAEYGIKVDRVGVKDIILPGDMKDILNQVVATEKAAQANVIRRREETAATRSLLNTAKLMDEHPTLMRLKEIEALEKVTEKVDRITVYDGLDGLLRDTVKLQV